MSERVVTEYFAAFARRDADAMAALWAPDGIDRLAGRGDLVGPNGVRDYFTELFGAFPDLEVTVESAVSEHERVAVHWKATGTMTGPMQGIQPTGARVEFEGLDLLQVKDGRIVHNVAMPDNLGVARQIGLLPPFGSTAEKRLNAAFNAGTRAARKAAASRELERVADGVWLLRGGVPRLHNVYFLEEQQGVTLFDAGIEVMARPIAAAAAQLGGIERVVLSHADADHRGAAPHLRAPVYVHPADRAAAESPDPVRDYHRIERMGAPARWVYPSLFRFWDGGAVDIAGTVEEGDEIAGFRVVHLPGHAPGQIALFRERDRLALTADCFYMLDIETTVKGAPRVPHRAYNQDEQQARESMRKLAALDPSAAWPAHAGPLTGDVRAQLEKAAAS